MVTNQHRQESIRKRPYCEIPCSLSRLQSEKTSHLFPAFPMSENVMIGGEKQINCSPSLPLHCSLLSPLFFPPSRFFGYLLDSVHLLSLLSCLSCPFPFDSCLCSLHNLLLTFLLQCLLFSPPSITVLSSYLPSSFLLSCPVRFLVSLIFSNSTCPSPSSSFPAGELFSSFRCFFRSIHLLSHHLPCQRHIT